MNCWLKRLLLLRDRVWWEWLDYRGLRDHVVLHLEGLLHDRHWKC
jgi:hypothetical protein